MKEKATHLAQAEKLLESADLYSSGSFEAYIKLANAHSMAALNERLDVLIYLLMSFIGE